MIEIWPVFFTFLSGRFAECGSARQIAATPAQPSEATVPTRPDPDHVPVDERRAGGGRAQALRGFHGIVIPPERGASSTSGIWSEIVTAGGSGKCAGPLAMLVAREGSCGPGSQINQSLSSNVLLRTERHECRYSRLSGYSLRQV